MQMIRIFHDMQRSLLIWRFSLIIHWQQTTLFLFLNLIIHWTCWKLVSFLLISLFYLHSTQWANTKVFILVLGFCEILSWQWHGHLWLEIQERITSLAVWLWRILVILIKQRNTSLKKFCREFVRNWTSYYPVPKEAKWRIQTFCTCITSACLVTKGACLQGKAYDEHRVLWSGN